MLSRTDEKARARDASPLGAWERAALRSIDAACYARYPRLARAFFIEHGALPRIAWPRYYFDRMQWRKLFDHNPLFVTFSDKLAAKAYIAARCPNLKQAKVLWQGTSVDDIPRELLKGDVVVKANHGCDFNFFIRNGRYDDAELARTARRWLAIKRYNGHHGEWAYGEVSPRLFVEEFLPHDASGLADINIRAGGGRFAYGILTLNAKMPRQSYIYLDRAGRRIGSTPGPDVSAADINRIVVPDVYSEAVRLGEVLSREVDFARFDFLVSGGNLYSGEITVYPSSGYLKLPTPDPAEPAGRVDLHEVVDDVWDWRRAWFFCAPLTGWRAAYRRLLLRAAFGEDRDILVPAG